MIVKFSDGVKSVYINPENIFSIHEEGDNRTHICFMEHGEYVDGNIDEVAKKLGYKED